MMRQGVETAGTNGRLLAIETAHGVRCDTLALA
jgi:hypothetical protein